MSYGHADLAHAGGYRRQRGNRTPRTTFGTFGLPKPYQIPEDVMKAYFHNLPIKTWLILALAAIVAAYPIVRIVLPAVVHAMVPVAVRELLHVI